MHILEKILLATDFTKSNTNAIESAIVLAKTFQSKIVLLHVLPKDVGNEKAKILLNKAASSELDKLVSHINEQGVKTDDPILEYGDHLDRIIHVSERINANMILIGAGQNIKNAAFKLGTTAQKIVQKSDKPVMVIQSGRYLDITKILCPVDFSEESKLSLHNAIVLAHRFNAELHILNVYEPAYKGPLHVDIEWGKQNELLRAKHKESMKQFLKGQNFTDLKVKTSVRSGDFAKVILNTIAKEKADFMVIGATGRKGLSRFFTGSVTEKVIREVPCSFVTVKQENFIELKLTSHVKDIETHFKNAKQLVKDGLFKDALNEFNVCLNISEMHIPSLNGKAMVYDILDEKKKAKKYKQLAKDVMSRIWDQKIEAEARRYYHR